MGDRRGRVGRGWVSDSILLVLAATSEESAGRVTRFRPDLRERVEEVRRDPGAFIQARKAGFQDADGEPDGAL